MIRSVTSLLILSFLHQQTCITQLGWDESMRTGSRGRARSRQVGMAPQKRGHDQADQILITKTLEARDEAEIGMGRVESGERIHFKKMRPARAIAANIDAATVAAAERAPRR